MRSSRHLDRDGPFEAEAIALSERRYGIAPSVDRQYSRIVGSWVGSIGLDAAAYGKHSMRRTKPSIGGPEISGRLLGHSKAR